MMIKRSSSNSSANFFNLPAYSIADVGSWMEHGPTITKALSSCPFKMAADSILPLMTDSNDFFVALISCCNNAGGINGSYAKIRVSSYSSGTGVLDIFIL